MAAKAKLQKVKDRRNVSRNPRKLKDTNQTPSMKKSFKTVSITFEFC